MVQQTRLTQLCPVEICKYFHITGQVSAYQLRPTSMTDFGRIRFLKSVNGRL